MADLQTQVNDLSTQLATVTTNFQQLSQAHDALVQQLDQSEDSAGQLHRNQDRRNDVSPRHQRNQS